MAFVNKSIKTPFSAEQMYKLVENVEYYPEFVDWCTKGKILNTQDNTVTAELTFEWNGAFYTFSTINKMTPHNHIDIKLNSGPFKKLCGHWYFNALNQHWCEISLNLEFEFDVPGLHIIFNPIFASMAHKWIEAFCLRAEEIYD